MTSPQTPEDAPLASPAAALDARYGRTPGSASRTRLIVILAAVAFGLVFVLWLWWGGLLGAPAQLEVKDVGHTIVDDTAVDVTWQLSIEPGHPAQCAVQALNSTFAIVGWVVVDLPPSDARTREFRRQVLTTEQAVTGLIYRCWLT